VIIDDKILISILVRYNGIGQEITPDEKEILLFALYNESVANKGIAYTAEGKCIDNTIDAKIPTS